MTSNSSFPLNSNTIELIAQKMLTILKNDTWKRGNSELVYANVKHNIIIIIIAMTSSSRRIKIRDINICSPFIKPQVHLFTGIEDCQ